MIESGIDLGRSKIMTPLERIAHELRQARIDLEEENNRLMSIDEDDEKGDMLLPANAEITGGRKPSGLIDGLG